MRMTQPRGTVDSYMQNFVENERMRNHGGCLQNLIIFIIFEEYKKS
jgi:hypothetical protein